MNSYWISSTEKFGIKNKIDNDYVCDVCIIGAGLCGLSTAYYLAKQGLKVIVVDKSGIGEKTSGHTTAKITLQHGLIYDYLINSFGVGFAMGYYESNKQAISNIKKIIDSENIDCDFEYQDNYIYATNKEDLVKINNEIKALNTLGEDAVFTDNCNLPFKISGAVETHKQAQFHPRKYMLGLAKAINNYGGLIFTDSLVSNVEKIKDSYAVFVSCNRNNDDLTSSIDVDGHNSSASFVINSKYVVIASHYPFINFPGFYFSKMYQSTSYAVAIETDKKPFDGMFLNVGEPTLSFRNAKYYDKNLLIIGGGTHKTGHSPESKDFYGYSYLEKEVSKFFPNSKILYKWDTRDCITLDKIPYIGEYSKLMPNVFVATGFNKWGMTSSNVAANIIAGQILRNEFSYLKNSKNNNLRMKNNFEINNNFEKNNNFKINNNFDMFEDSKSDTSNSFTLQNYSNNDTKLLISFSKKYEKVYDSSRFNPIKNRDEMKNMVGQVFQSFVSNRVKIPSEDLFTIEKGNGGIVRINGVSVGIYRDESDNVFAVNPTCTHLGCLLTWNNVDKTWDCPCHGSRFDYTGKNLYDPAFKDLETYRVD